MAWQACRRIAKLELPIVPYNCEGSAPALQRTRSATPRQASDTQSCWVVFRAGFRGCRLRTASRPALCDRSCASRANRPAFVSNCTLAASTFFSRFKTTLLIKAATTKYKRPLCNASSHSERLKLRQRVEGVDHGIHIAQTRSKMC